MTGSALRAIDEDLWCADGLLRVGPGFWFTTRMVVIRTDEGLWLHSPIEIDEAMAAAIEALGPVRFIVAPSLMHHLFAGPAKERWPQAKLFAPAALGKKRADLAIDEALAVEGPGPWSASIDQVFIAGAPSVDEFVFFHRSTRSLIVTDLIFNIHQAPGWATPWILRMVGAWRRPAQSRIWRAGTKDKAAAGAAARKVLDWKAQRLIPAHGELLEGQACEAGVAGALAWMAGAG
ncbi:MAG: DUF4336 domain-containing protein [Myxococcales bacterium]|nr:DUF4336 domain-containing protein [Myxococcales bacterium]